MGQRQATVAQQVHYKLMQVKEIQQIAIKEARRHHQHRRHLR